MIAEASKDTPQRRPALISGAISLLLFGLFYLYVLLMVDTSVIYHQQWPVFLTTGEYLNGFLGVPGGLATYASLFIAQSYYFPWAGALVLTAMAWLICINTALVLRTMAGRPLSPLWSMVPVLILLAGLSRFNLRAEATLPIVIALVSFNLYAAIKPRNMAVRLILIALLGGMVFYVAGGICILLALLVFIYELLRRGNYVSAALSLLLGAGMGLAVGWYSYGITYGEAFRIWLPFPQGIAPSWSSLTYPPAALQLAMLAFFPIAALIARASDRLQAIMPAFIRNRTQPSERSANWTMASLFVVIVAGSAIWFYALDRPWRSWLRIHKYSQTRQWAQLLSEARKLPPGLYDEYVFEHVNRALYHTGRLLADGFEYPQGQAIYDSAGQDLMPKLLMPYWNNLSIIHNSQVEVLFELGRMHLALQRYHDMVELEGQRPNLLRKSAQIYLLKGQPETAKIFMRALGENLLFKNESREFLAKLEQDPSFSFDEELVHAKSVMLTEDYLNSGGSEQVYKTKFLQLLNHDPDNRMAFEYLMFHYLLTRKNEPIAQLLPRMRELGYPQLPKAVQQALVIHIMSNRDKNIDLHGYEIDKLMIDRGQSFNRIAFNPGTSTGFNKEAAIGRLQDDFGGDYYFYFTFGFSVSRPEGYLPAYAAVTGASK